MSEDRSLNATVAFKTTPNRKRLIEAAAAMGGVTPSAFLRQATDAALEGEFGMLPKVGSAERAA